MTEENGKKPIQVFSHDEPELLRFKEKISKYIGQAETQNMPYWVILEGEIPISVIILGIEPVRLIAPIGTPMTVVKIIESPKIDNNWGEIARESIKISEEKSAKYSYVQFTVNQTNDANRFIDAGYENFGETYEMECTLESKYFNSKNIQFERVQRDELNHFLSLMKIHMSGSPDQVLEIILDNICDMPDGFLDFWYKLEHLFLVYKEGKVVGMLDINVKEGTISNIGVDPEFRGKGYGREIMKYGLQVLKENGCKKASLRVHSENYAAIHLYETLGFKTINQMKHLIWWSN
jgi:ribosomal-protein-alanine N-acetyltransferase